LWQTKARFMILEFDLIHLLSIARKTGFQKLFFNHETITDLIILIHVHI
jgi:hypothetical protein